MLEVLVHYFVRIRIVELYYELSPHAFLQALLTRDDYGS